MANKLLRVTQMNAVYFDKEVYNLFQKHIQDGMKFLPPTFATKFDKEMYLLLRLAIINYSIMKHDSTFGQKLLSIKYGNITETKKYLILLASCFDYIRERFLFWNPGSPCNNTVAALRYVLNVLSLVNISIFLRTGQKPLLIERILGLSQIYTSDNVQRQFETKYMTREILWNGFIEILVYILPLINYHKIVRTVRHINPLHSKPIPTLVVNRKFDFSTKCTYCSLNPILPHHMGCAHIFCYSCLKGNQMADSKYECPKCEFTQGLQNICERVSVN